MPEPFAQSIDDFPEAHEPAAADRASEDRCRNQLGWLVVVGAAGLCFELTGNVPLAVALGCLKFGWSDFRIAFKLHQTDPDRPRGRVCAYFYIALGLWKVTLVALALMIGIVWAEGALRVNPNPAQPAGLPASFGMACVVWLVGLGLSAMVSTVAATAALWRSIKVWVGARRNYAGMILIGALIVEGTVGGLTLLIACGPWLARLALGAGAFVWLMMTALVGAGSVSLLVFEQVRRRIVAATPEQCWPTSLDRDAGPFA
jgi:hypothetical protein